MVFDLVAEHGQRAESAPERMRMSPVRAARVLIFDSGLGGLSVFPHVATACPGADLVYAADDAVFPYGRLSEPDLIDRVLLVMEALIRVHAPDVVVIACNTASTLVLAPLRARWPAIGFVGTVPAIKPAATASTSRLISVLATPGTVARAYTRDLVERFAGDCAVRLVGAPRLASLAEASMRGEHVGEALIAAEIAPAFIEEGTRRTDVVVLACTHYPLLLPLLDRLAPWRVSWIDPAAAIARQAGRLLADSGLGAVAERAARLAPAVFTSDTPPGPALAAFLERCGVSWHKSPALQAIRAA